MSFAPTVISFGEWLPDQPDFGSQGLTEANNVLPDVGYYRPYNPLAAFSPGSYTLPGQARGLFLATDNVQVFRPYGATSQTIYMATTSGVFQTRVASSLTSTTVFDWQFAQFDNLVFACNHDNTLVHTVGALTNFATCGAPSAGVVGVINQFVMVGDLREATDRPQTVRWSAIDDPLNWPTPNSATALATQAGEQTLNSSFGIVQGITGGDQHGLIFQEFGITRVTYAGPPTVLQFDIIDKTRGALNRHGIVKVGDQVYFHAHDGFYVTDGVSVRGIGSGKVDKFFTSSAGSNDHVRGVFDQVKKCVMWSFPEGATTTANRVFAFHVETGMWTRANQIMRSADGSQVGAAFGPYAFDTNNIMSYWRSTAGAVGTALLSTADVEISPGGRGFVTGAKPHVQSSSTPPVITVRVGSRNDLGSSPSYTATTTPTTRTGFADVRVDAKYHRAEVQIVGNFEKASGLEFNGMPSGQV